MSRPNNGGWDFIKVGKTYQYKEEIGPMSVFLSEVTILEDNSDEEYYSFKIRVENSNINPPGEEEIGVFNVGHMKNPGGYYSGMPQFYETPEYSYEPKWKRAE